MNVKPIRPVKQTRPRHVQHAPMASASTNGHSRPRTTYAEPTLTREQRRIRDDAARVRTMMHEFANACDFSIGDVSDDVIRLSVVLALLRLAEVDRASFEALRGTTFSDADWDVLERHDVLGSATTSVIRLNSPALRQLSKGARLRTVGHELAHVYLRHYAQQHRPAHVIETEAWAQTYRWGF